MKTNKQGRTKPSSHASKALRENAVQRVLAGESPEKVISELGFHRSRIYAWIKDHREQEKRAHLSIERSSELPRGSSVWAISDSLFKTPPPPLSVNHIDDWVLLLNQSLLDFQYPLTAFLDSLNRAIIGSAVIAPDLGSPAFLIRAIYKKTQLNDIINLNRIVADAWQDNPFKGVFDKPGQVLMMDEVIPRDKWKENNFCRLFTAYGASNAMALSFSGVENSIGGLFLFNGGERKFEKQLTPFLKKLRPHLETAMALAIHHWRSNFTVKALEEATDHLVIAALVLDGNGRIIKASGAAEEMLDKKHFVKQQAGQLDFLTTENQKQFEQAVKQSIAWRRAPVGNKPTEAMRFSYPSGESIGVLVQAITPPSLAIPHAIAASPHVMLYISDPTKARPGPQHQLIMRLFKLSTREARLATLLTEGHTLNEVADLMNITQTTARTYLQHIYDKVGVNKRQDLVQLIMKSVALLA